MVVPLLAGAVGLGISAVFAPTVRQAVMAESDATDRLEIEGAPDPIGDFADSIGTSSGMPDMATSNAGLDITGILAPLAVFIAFLVFGRTVIQELI